MRFIFCLLLTATCCSCAMFHHGMDNTFEFGKVIWGSSTKALEQARDHALTKTYDKPYWDCVHKAVLAVARKKWVIFKKQEAQGYMVVMGVKGCVNTTEIGVFFVALSSQQTRIEVSSLSTNAKRKVARGLFHELDIAFGYLPPDPPEPELKKVPDTTLGL